jgi:hypothetical protein
MWRLRHLFIVIYILIGLVVAWDRGYASFGWLKTLPARCWRSSSGGWCSSA